MPCKKPEKHSGKNLFWSGFWSNIANKSKEMRKSLIILLLVASFFTNYLFSEEKYKSFPDQEIEQLSFYMGYLIGHDHAKNSYDFQIKFEKLVEGMKAGLA